MNTDHDGLTKGDNKDKNLTKKEKAALKKIEKEKAKREKERLKQEKAAQKKEKKGSKLTAPKQNDAGRASSRRRNSIRCSIPFDWGPSLVEFSIFQTATWTSMLQLTLLRYEHQVQYLLQFFMYINFPRRGSHYFRLIQPGSC